MPVLVKVLCAAVLLFAGLWPVQAPAQQAERVIIVLDVSGSMGGKIRGQRKIDIARTVIRNLLGDWNPATELGLIAYGHRRKGDCSDIETIVPVGKVDPGSVAEAMSRLRPVGMTPLSAAVRRAAETLRYTEQKATVILVSDGAETCKADPCALGRELESKGVDFVAHVVGFSVATKEQQGLKCLAGTTGGLFVSARTANQLHEALQRTIKQVERPKPKPAAPPPPPKVDTSKNNARFAAVYAPGGEKIRSNIRWRIEQKIVTVEAGREKVTFKRASATVEQPEPVFTLAPGDYRVVVEVGSASATEEFQVKAGEIVDKTINLNAGVATFRAVYSAGGERVKSGLQWHAVRKFVSGELGRQKTEWRRATHTAEQPEVTYILNAGDYRINLKVGSATASQAFTIKAGAVVDETIDLDAGVAKFKAVYSAGGEQVKSGLQWFAERKFVSGELGRQKTEWKRATHTEERPEATYILNAGEYRINLRVGSATVTEPFTIKAGAALDKTIDLNAGIVKFTAVYAAGGEQVKSGLQWFAERKFVGGELGRQKTEWRRATHTETRPEANYILNAGEYRINLKVGSATASEPFQVKAGQSAAIVIDAKAAPVKLGAVSASGEPVRTNLRWHVERKILAGEPGQQKVQWRRASHTIDRPEAAYILNAGEHRAVVSRGNETVTKEFVVEAGKPGTITVTLP